MADLRERVVNEMQRRARVDGFTDLQDIAAALAVIAEEHARHLELALGRIHETEQRLALIQDAHLGPEALSRACYLAKIMSEWVHYGDATAAEIMLMRSAFLAEEVDRIWQLTRLGRAFLDASCPITSARLAEMRSSLRAAEEALVGLLPAEKASVWKAKHERVQG